MIRDSLSNNASDITTEACAWIAQLETGDLTEADLTAFREWMARSPAHRKEIRHLAHLSGEVNILAEMALPLKVAATEGREAVKRKSSKMRYVVAPVLVFTLFCFGVFFSVQKNLSFVGPVLITTDVGGLREVNLSDGTVVKLNTDTEVEIDYSPDRRKVRLLKGEAFFQVAHNPDRPFIVYVKGHSVRAVGTAFVVSLLSKKLEVIVTEGHVELVDIVAMNSDVVLEEPQNKKQQQKTPKPSIPVLHLKAGESISYENSIQKDPVTMISEREIIRKLSWQTGFLDFSETPLIEVVEDLGRYTSLKVEISDPELRELKFGGIFRINELDALFDVLETTFDIRVEYVNDKLVRLSLNEGHHPSIH